MFTKSSLSNFFVFGQVKSQKGQGLVEYSVVLALVAVAAITATALFGTSIKTKLAQLSMVVSGNTKKEVTEYGSNVQKSMIAEGKKATTKGSMNIKEDALLDGGEALDGAN